MLHRESLWQEKNGGDVIATEMYKIFGWEKKKDGRMLAVRIRLRRGNGSCKEKKFETLF